MKQLTPVGSDLEELIDESKNTVRYSLFLKDIVSKDSPYVKRILEEKNRIWACIKSTTDILGEIVFCHAKDHCYFGRNDKTVFKNDQALYGYGKLGKSSYLDNGFGGRQGELGEDFFIGSLMNHVVVSTYDIVSCASSGEERVSLSQLSKSDILSSKRDESDVNIMNRENSRISQKIDSHIKVLRDLELPDIFSIQNHSVPKSQLHLFKKLFLDIEADKLRRGFGIFSDCDEYRTSYYKKCIEDYLDLYNSCFDGAEKFSVADDILNKYRVENIFAKRLVCTTLEGLRELEEVGAPRPAGANELEILSMASSLPNVFSRDAFVMYALYFLGGEKDRYIDTHYFENITSSSEPMSRSTFTIQGWLIKFKQFCTYYSDFLIPMAQWIFYILLEGVLSLENTLSNESNDKVDQLNKMKGLLSEYIEANRSLILNPLEAYQDMKIPNDAPIPEITGKNRAQINSLMIGCRKSAHSQGVYGMKLTPYNISHGSLGSIENIANIILSTGTKISMDLPYKDMVKTGLVTAYHRASTIPEEFIIRVKERNFIKY